MLGTVAANYIPGDPVWLMLVGPPSSGKTELLNSLGKLRDVHTAGPLTEAGLLSGSPKREVTSNATGGLLKQIGKFGFLVMKDFTSILSMHRERQAAVLAAFREIYDGKWTRPLGTDGGRSLKWSGKLAVLAGVTQAIDSHHAVMATMGERFVFCRLPVTNGEAQAEMALAHASQSVEMRDELSGAVANLFQHLRIADPLPSLSDTRRGRLIGLASLAARLRSAVERDPRSREIELVHDPESPNRLALVFRKLLAGLEAIGVSEHDTWTVLRSLALDSAPLFRRKVFDAVARERAEIPTALVSERVPYSPTKVRRTLEELGVHRVVKHIPAGSGRADSWILTEETEMLYSSLFEDRSRTVG
jgi:hypothetical protein